MEKVVHLRMSRATPVIPKAAYTDLGTFKLARSRFTPYKPLSMPPHNLNMVPHSRLLTVYLTTCILIAFPEQVCQV